MLTSLAWLPAEGSGEGGIYAGQAGGPPPRRCPQYRQDVRISAEGSLYGFSPGVPGPQRDSGRQGRCQRLRMSRSARPSPGTGPAVGRDPACSPVGRLHLRVAARSGRRPFCHCFASSAEPRGRRTQPIKHLNLPALRAAPQNPFLSLLVTATHAAAIARTIPADMKVAAIPRIAPRHKKVNAMSMKGPRVAIPIGCCHAEADS